MVSFVDVSSSLTTTSLVTSLISTLFFFYSLGNNLINNNKRINNEIDNTPGIRKAINSQTSGRETVNNGTQLDALGTDFSTPYRYINNVEELDPDEILYCVFDLETTGFSKDRNYIIEIACMLCDDTGSPLPDGKYAELVKPPVLIPNFISELTGITNNDVKDKATFEVIGKDFMEFIIDRMRLWEDENASFCRQLILVAHNGQKFDVPFLFEHFHRNGLSDWLQISDRLYLLDTLELAKHAIQKDNLPIPDNYKLSSLYYYCTKSELGESAHRADVDVEATQKVLSYVPFWNLRLGKIYKIDGFGKVDMRKVFSYTVPLTSCNSPNDDSDTDDSTDTVTESIRSDINEQEDENEELIDDDNDTKQPADVQLRNFSFETIRRYSSIA